MGPRPVALESQAIGAAERIPLRCPRRSLVCCAARPVGRSDGSKVHQTPTADLGRRVEPTKLEAAYFWQRHADVREHYVSIRRHGAVGHDGLARVPEASRVAIVGASRSDDQRETAVDYEDIARDVSVA